jgi:two-component system sensor histidine kinase DegS
LPLEPVQQEVVCRRQQSALTCHRSRVSLFRVLQEALNNAIKHSGVKQIELQQREDSGKIHLVIRDLGRSFDVEAASQDKGLGLISMRERLRLLNGAIEIQSKPMGGITIHVRVPLESA